MHWNNFLQALSKLFFSPAALMEVSSLETTNWKLEKIRSIIWIHPGQIIEFLVRKRLEILWLLINMLVWHLWFHFLWLVRMKWEGWKSELGKPLPATESAFGNFLKSVNSDCVCLHTWRHRFSCCWLKIKFHTKFWNFEEFQAVKVLWNKKNLTFRQKKNCYRWRLTKILFV